MMTFIGDEHNLNVNHSFANFFKLKIEVKLFKMDEIFHLEMNYRHIDQNFYFTPENRFFLRDLAQVHRFVQFSKRHS